MQTIGPFNIAEINQALSTFKEEFCEQTLSLAKELIKNPCFEVALVTNFLNLGENHFHLNEIKEVIQDTANNTEKCFIYVPRKTNWFNFINNEIRCLVTNKFNQHIDITLRNAKRAECMGTYSYNCFEEYSKKLQNSTSYKELSSFSAFTDFEIPKEEYRNLIKKNQLDVETKAWNQYIGNLIITFLPSFTKNDSVSTAKMQRFTKPIHEQWSLGIEFDKTSLNKSKRTGFFEFPEYFNLILINNAYDKKSKADYLYDQTDPNIISFGIMGNPFFYTPAMTPFACYIELCNSYLKGPLLPTPSPLANVEKETEQVKIIYKEADVESLKKYVYFYMDILCYTSNGYIDFVEKVIKKVLG